MQVHTPTTLDDALDLLARDGDTLRPIAGATDLCVSWPAQPKDDLRLLDLSRLAGELRPLRMTDADLELGALTTYWDVITNDEVAREFPLLAQAARQVGAVQIQSRGTWAGNIVNASPAADGVLALMAYDARVVLRSKAGETEVALDQFYTGYKEMRRQPDQLITAIRVPRRRRQREWLHKVGARSAQAITKVGVAVVQDEAGWRVVANSVAPMVCRCRNMEKALAAGTKFAAPADVARVLSADISPIDDIRSTARYRATVLSRLLHFWLAEQT